MAAEPRIGGEINLVMNRLVQVGAIAGFKTILATHNGAGAPLVTVTVPEGRSLEEVRVRVMDAFADVAIGLNVKVQSSP